MQVDDALVEKLSRLSMLQFNEEEKEAIKADLQRMIGFMDKIRELDLDGVEPLLHMSENPGALRDDIPGGMISAEEALKNATHHDGRFFKVPRVINKPAR
jgi:aspartyl-tRNA(Asn)/glutamyl-tRNA(Gln) amidotransferase subunit C